MAGLTIHTIAEEFTKDLESFVKNPIQLERLQVWAPRKPAAPERHKALGTAQGIEPDVQLYYLEQENTAFDTMESMLRIFLSLKQYVMLPPPDAVKEQVWVFAYRWFNTYYDMLTEPGILHTEFYKKEHERFLDVLRGMLLVLPSQRSSFIEALRQWCPGSPALVEPIATELPVATSAVTSAVAEPPPPVAVSESSVTKKTRLVLSAPRDFEERNKTRKICRSSNRSPATDNHEKPVRD